MTTTTPTPSATFQIRAIIAPMGAIVLGAFMSMLDATIVNVALPTLGQVFQADILLLQWVIIGYMLASAAVIPLAGWLGDRFGAKRIYLTALALFTAGSGLCAAAVTGEMLVVFRVVQGLGGGLLMPIGMAFLYQLAPPERRGAVMGIFGVPILLGPTLGPLLCGWLLEAADWRLIFLINLPIGAFALWLGYRALPSVKPLRAPGRLDIVGAILAPIAFTSLSYGISQLPTAGPFGPSTLAGVLIGGATLAAFIRHELRTPDPLLDLRVFALGEFRRTIITAWTAQAALFGTMFLVPLFLQGVRGYGPLETGLYTVPQTLAAGVTMPFAGRIFDKMGVRFPVVTGMIVATGSLVLLSQVSGSSSGADMAVAFVLWGAGIGLFMMPLNTHLLNSTPPELVGRVTSLNSALQNVIWSFGTASAATLLASRIEARLATGGADAIPFAYGDVYLAATVVALLAIPQALRLHSHVHRKEPPGAVPQSQPVHLSPRGGGGALSPLVGEREMEGA